MRLKKRAVTYPDFLGEIDFSRMFLGCDAPYGWVQGWGIEGGAELHGWEKLSGSSVDLVL